MRPLFPFVRWSLISAMCGLALVACHRSKEAALPASAPEPAAPPTLTLPKPVVDRTELLRALDEAGSAYAAGQVTANTGLAGRRFILRQAFGCSGPVPPNVRREPGIAAWSLGSKSQTIELTLQPADWMDLAASDGPERAWEAVEGFWLPRPWLRTDGCPAPHQGETPVAEAPSPDALTAPARQTAGLAAVFERGGSRLGRRDGKPFTFVVRGDDRLPPSPPVGGYRVVLEGRFAQFPDGRAIQCRAAGVDSRPVCIVAANVDRMAFETADGQLLSEWRGG
jgi:hypothetical protein